MPPAGAPLGRRPIVLLCLATVALHAAMLAVSRVSDRRLASCEAPYAEHGAAEITSKAGQENAAFVMLMGPSALSEVGGMYKAVLPGKHMQLRSEPPFPAKRMACGKVLSLRADCHKGSL